MPSLALAIAIGASGAGMADPGRHSKHAWTVRSVAGTMVSDGEGGVFGAGPSYEVDFDGDIHVWRVRGEDGVLESLYLVGGPSGDSASDIVLHGAVGIFAIGSFRGTVDFDPGLKPDWHTAPSLTNAFLLHLDVGGGFQWALSFEGPGQTTGKRLCVDPAGDLILTGGLFESVDFDPSEGVDVHTEPGRAYDVFVSKFTADGQYLWTRTFGGLSYDTSSKVATDGDGNILVSGDFRGQADFDPGPGTAYYTAQTFPDDFFITKLYADGSYAWTVPYPLSLAQNDFVVTPDAGVVIPGGFSAEIDFDRGAGEDVRSPAPPDPPGDPTADLFVTKLKADGSYAWTYTATSDGRRDRAVNIELLPDGDLLILGDFEGTIDFDPGPGVAQHTALGGPTRRSTFLLRLAPDGAFRSVAVFDYSLNGDFPKLAADAAENIFFSRLAYPVADLDPTCEVDVRSNSQPNNPLPYITKLTCAPRTADFDSDGDLDLADFAAFQNCFEGFGATTCNPGCDEFDLIPDKAIDAADFAEMSPRLSGP